MEFKKDRLCYIYRCIRGDTGEVFYVGSTIDKRRLNYWKRYDQPYFLAVVESVGVENCRSEIIETVPEEIRFDREAYWTLYYFERYDLANRTIADNRYTPELKDKVFSPEIRQKMSDAWTEERRRQQALRAHLCAYGRHIWEDVEKLSQMKENVRAWWTDARRAERSNMYKGENNPNYGKGEKVRGELNGMYGVHLTGELNGMWGKKHSAETRKLISERAKAAVNTPEARQKFKESITLKNKSVEAARTLPISEIFYSLQGEGRHSGEPTIFIRMFGCPLDCSYCDSHYATKGEDFIHVPVNEIIEKVEQLAPKCRNICVTGGEPLIHPNTRTLLRRLAERKYIVDVETCGAVDPTPFYISDKPVSFTVDYKCPSSGMEAKMLPEVFNNIRKKDTLKFVVGTKEDLEAMLREVRTHKFPCPVYVSPVFGEVTNQEIAEFILSHEELTDVKMQLQIHKYVWDKDKRGV